MPTTPIEWISAAILFIILFFSFALICGVIDVSHQQKKERKEREKDKAIQRKYIGYP